MEIDIMKKMKNIVTNCEIDIFVITVYKCFSGTKNVKKYSNLIKFYKQLQNNDILYYNLNYEELSERYENMDFCEN